MEDIDGGLHPAVDGQSLDEDVVLNFQKEMYIPLKRFRKKTLFTGDVSVHWATGRRGQTS